MHVHVDVTDLTLSKDWPQREDGRGGRPYRKCLWVTGDSWVQVMRQAGSPRPVLQPKRARLDGIYSPRYPGAEFVMMSAGTGCLSNASELMLSGLPTHSGCRRELAGRGGPAVLRFAPALSHHSVRMRLASAWYVTSPLAAQPQAAGEAEAPIKTMRAASVSGSRGDMYRARQGRTEPGQDEAGNDELETHLPNACVTSSQAVRRSMRSSSSTGTPVPTTRVNWLCLASCAR